MKNNYTKRSYRIQINSKKDIKDIKEYLKNLGYSSERGSEETKKQIEESKDNFYLFVQNYLKHLINFTTTETSVFRRFVYDEFLNIAKNSGKIAITAYRGAAKTTLISKLYILWRIAKADTSYAVIISSTMDTAIEVLETIKIELEDNSKLKNDFKIELATPWTIDEIVFSVDRKKIKIRACGAGKKIRGLNFMGHRPDIIICDDIENDENIESKKQREKLKNWFTKAILKLVDRNEKSNIIVVGTILHYDSLLSYLSKRKDFKSFNFPLVRSFPDNIDMMTEENIDNFDFSGFEPDDKRIDPVEIFKEFIADKTSFYSEYQNQPIEQDNAIFSSFETFESEPICDAYVIGVDPALGKTKGDYFAVALLGYSKESKKFYLSAQGYKIPPEKMIDVIIEKYIDIANKDKNVKIAIETVQFQAFFSSVLKEEAKKKGIHIPVVEIKNSISKELRIDSMAPLISDKTIIIDEKSHLLIEEIMTYPKSNHDDLLDASEMAFRILSKVQGINYDALKTSLKGFFNVKNKFR